MFGHSGHGLPGARVSGGRGKQLELVDRRAALPVHRAEAVGAGVAPADDHHVLAPGVDEPVVGDVVTLAALVLQREELHREVDARELAAGNRKITGDACATGEDDRVVLALQLAHRHAAPDIRVGTEGHTFLLHQREPAVEDAFLHLELGDAIAEETADAIRALEHRHHVTRAVELVGGGEARGAGAHDGDLLARPLLRRLRAHPAALERALDDRDLDGLDRHRVVVDPEHARAFAGRGAEAARPLREVVRRVQPLNGVLPVVAVHEVVPVRDDVAERTALVAERNAAVHAARRLLLELGLREGEIDLFPVAQTLVDRTRRPLLALDLEEAGDLTHWCSRRAPRTWAHAPPNGRALPRAARACSPSA